VSNLHAEFEVSSFNRYQNMEGVKNFLSRSREAFTITFDLILHYFVYVPPAVNLRVPNLKFLASTVPEIWRWSQNFNSRSRDPFTTTFDLILHFLSLGPSVADLCAKFDVSIALTVPQILR